MKVSGQLYASAASPSEINSDIHFTGGSVGPTAGPNPSEKKCIAPAEESNHDC
jgi:hypothetical protein